MKKRIIIISTIITILLVIAAVIVTVLFSCNKKPTYTQGLVYTLDESTGGYMVEGVGSASSAHLIIPPTVNGLPVTAIGAEAFQYCDFITQITIPDSVVAIGNLAFYGTGYYKNNDNWDREALYIGKHLIKVNEQKTGSLVIREGTVNIAACALYECKNLTRVTVPEGLKSIGFYSFYKCEQLVNIAIPDSVTRIDTCAFKNCSALKEAKVPDGVTYFGNYVFEQCTSLETCALGGGITEISYYTFNNCSSLTQVVIPESVTSIARNAFYNCGKLTGVTIPQGVGYIGKNAFYGCRSLTEAIFANNSGWFVTSSESAESGTDIPGESLSDPSAAAKLLNSTYSGYHWKRA